MKLLKFVGGFFLLFQTLLTGLCVAAVHVHRSPDLANHLRVTSIPELMGLVNGRVIYMKWDTLALQDLRDFVRHLFPKETLPMVSF